MDIVMKVRNNNELIDYLAGKKKVRKRELISLSQDLAKLGGKELDRVCRASVVLAYAHWEGFVKDAARAYVNFVSYKSRNLSDLSLNFQALACRQEILTAQGATRRVKPHIVVTKRFIEDTSLSFQINAETAIDTESNLNSEVFENICTSVGIEYSAKWATDGPFMDDLFVNRCAVAHGELYSPDKKYAIEVLEFIIKSIDSFSTDIENLALLNKYLR